MRHTPLHGVKFIDARATVLPTHGEEKTRVSARASQVGKGISLSIEERNYHASVEIPRDMVPHIKAAIESAERDDLTVEFKRDPIW